MLEFSPGHGSVSLGLVWDESPQHGITSSSCSGGEVQTLSPSQEYFLTNQCPRETWKSEHSRKGKPFWSTGMIPFLCPGEHLAGRGAQDSSNLNSQCKPLLQEFPSQTLRVYWKMLLLSDE